MASVGSGLVDFAIAFGLLLILMVFYRVGLLRLNSDAAGFGGPDKPAGHWYWNVDVRTDCEISRYSVRAPVFDTARPVCDSDNLSGEHGA